MSKPNNKHSIKHYKIKYKTPISYTRKCKNPNKVPTGKNGRCIYRQYYYILNGKEYQLGKAGKWMDNMPDTPLNKFPKLKITK